MSNQPGEPADSNQPVHDAAIRGDLEALRRELAQGVSPACFSLANERGYTPLTLLCAQPGDDDAPRLACINLLVEAGADPNAALEANLSKWTPLHFAAAYGRAKLACALIEAGANVNQLSASDESPLHVASQFSGSSECVVVLIRAGATVNARNYRGQTTLDVERWNRRDPRTTRRIYATLLRAGAELPAETESEYLRKVIAAGSFQNYERAHLNALAGIFAPKFSHLLPPEMVRRVLEFSFLVGGGNY